MVSQFASNAINHLRVKVREYRIKIKSLKIVLKDDDSYREMLLRIEHFISQCYERSLKKDIVVCRRYVQLFSMATSQSLSERKSNYFEETLNIFQFHFRFFIWTVKQQSTNYTVLCFKKKVY